MFFAFETDEKHSLRVARKHYYSRKMVGFEAVKLRRQAGLARDGITSSIEFNVVRNVKQSDVDVFSLQMIFGHVFEPNPTLPSIENNRFFHNAN